MIMQRKSKGAAILKRIFIFTGLMVCFMSGPATMAEQDFFSQKTWEGIFTGERAQENSLNGYPVIFVYGIAGNFNHWERTLKTISGSNYYNIGFLPSGKVFHNYHGEKQNLWIWNASYYTSDIVAESVHGNLTLYAERLQELIGVIKGITQKDKVVIIAHSMGGLVSRKYMTLSRSNWDSVYKILTVATPNEGVSTSVGVVGQLADLTKNGKFIKKLNADWARMENKESKWGVIGAIDSKMFFNRKIGPNDTDSSGPGFVAISSAIPFGEWKDAALHINQIAYHTPHFAFRLAVNAKHMQLLYHEATFEGIDWAVQK